MQLRSIIFSAAACLFATAVPASGDISIVRFREQHSTTYRVELLPRASSFSSGAYDWTRAWDLSSEDRPVAMSNRIMLQLQPHASPEAILDGMPLRIDRQIGPHLFILAAWTSTAAIRASEQLALDPDVASVAPVMKRPKQLFQSYTLAPSDPYFSEQWHLESRNSSGQRTGIDVNARAAWPVTLGAGVTIAIADEGVELTHPDLVDRVQGQPHYNFEILSTNGAPLSPDQIHGTAVAGLAAASANNNIGIAGVAPEAGIASWTIFATNDTYFWNGYMVSEESLMDMFQYQSNVVAVQNHSWGNADTKQLAPSLLEQTAISNAVTFGRNGLGVVIVRSGGNFREDGGNQNVNDDGYPSDPKAIAVAAVRQDGRAASYSNPGACLLVGAPSGDLGSPKLFSTDRAGALGYNSNTSSRPDYAFGSTGFSGTSGSAPLVAGIAALILSANPALGYRDVQQILIHSSFHQDRSDPDLAPNGAGFEFSHNLGFGIPDAGVAVALARAWQNRPPLTTVTVEASSLPVAIPDLGLRVKVSGPGISSTLQSIASAPSFGPHADEPTASVELVNLGLLTEPVTQSLAGKGALIQRGVSLFSEKIEWAANAGAAFAIIYNNRDADQLVQMAGTYYSRIPAVFIGQTDGNALVAAVAANPQLTAGIALAAASAQFEVTDTLLCEHVGIRIKSDHTSRSHLRITLLSPSGTRSVLQHVNSDDTPGPKDWTYYSTKHFYEPSAGTWSVHVSDQVSGHTGSLMFGSLTLLGVPISDSDSDGLDDAWELAQLGSLDFSAVDDPDNDGYSNAREQILGSLPLVPNTAIELDLSLWNESHLRLAWPSGSSTSFDLFAASKLGLDPVLVTNVPARFPITDFILPLTGPARFFHLRSNP